MSLSSRPARVRPDLLTTIALLSGSPVPVGSGTGITKGRGGGVPTAASTAVTKAQLAGLRAFKHDNADPKVGQTGGEVVVVVYKDSGLTEELTAVTFDFSTRSTDSATFTQPIDMWEQAFIQSTGDATSVGDFLDITPILGDMV
jgi:hypothetical protein